MNVKNDLAFLADFSLYLYEHQSTVNPNMPLRFLQYVAREYERLIRSDTLYGDAQVSIPEPQFVVFYNGVGDFPERTELKLSDAFLRKNQVGTEPQLELKVQVWNINAGNNEELKAQCKVLGEYMQYVDCVRKYLERQPVEEAVVSAVDECIERGVLSDFLRKNKAEVVPVSIFEYDEEAVREVIRRSAEQRGLEQGEALLAQLIGALLKAGRQEDVQRAIESPDARETLYREFGLKK